MVFNYIRENNLLKNKKIHLNNELAELFKKPVGHKIKTTELFMLLEYHIGNKKKQQEEEEEKAQKEQEEKKAQKEEEEEFSQDEELTWKEYFWSFFI